MNLATADPGVTLVLGASDILALLQVNGRDTVMDLAIAALDAAFRQRDLAYDHTPPRSGFLLGDPDDGCLEWMPHHQAGRAVTIKVVAYKPTNSRSSAFPTIVGTVGRWNVDNGHLEALMDGVVLTALRTGAMSAVASRRLAASASATLGIVGAGAQAVTQIHALSRILPLERVVAYDRCPEAADSLADRVAPYVDATVETTSLDRLEQVADIICTATSVAPGAGPVLPGHRLQPHVHINAIGADLPGKTELPLDVLRRSLVVPDMLEQATAEGECQQLSADEIGPELHKLLQTDDASWRDQPTVFDSTGMALQDHVVADLLQRLALEQGLGSSLEVEHVPVDPRNPYGVARTGPRR
jgi:ornithine cyclodeaminase/alanine dehydrogenase-like protein (mu-crystallin family)